MTADFGVLDGVKGILNIIGVILRDVNGNQSLEIIVADSQKRMRRIETNL